MAVRFLLAACVGLAFAAPAEAAKFRFSPGKAAAQAAKPATPAAAPRSSSTVIVVPGIRPAQARREEEKRAAEPARVLPPRGLAAEQPALETAAASAKKSTGAPAPVLGNTMAHEPVTLPGFKTLN
jgi:hypothetical protein